MRCGSVLAGAVCALARQANVLSAGLLDLRVPYLTPHPPPSPSIALGGNDPAYIRPCVLVHMNSPKYEISCELKIE